ncbi:MAG: hypothetical protein AAFN17_09000 [Pseudomonadota bacterium]
MCSLFSNTLPPEAITGSVDRAAELLRPFDEGRMRIVLSGEDAKSDEGEGVG